MWNIQLNFINHFSYPVDVESIADGFSNSELFPFFIKKFEVELGSGDIKFKSYIRKTDLQNEINHHFLVELYRGKYVVYRIALDSDFSNSDINKVTYGRVDTEGMSIIFFYLSWVY